MKEKEHQSVEWKQAWRDEYLKWICGYANAYGGTYISEQMMMVMLLELIMRKNC